MEVEFTEGWAAIVEYLVDSPFTTPKGNFVAILGLKTTAAGNIKVDARYETSVPGVFAAGDCVTTQKVAPFASASGQLAALAAFRQLNGYLYEYRSMLDQ